MNYSDAVTEILGKAAQIKLQGRNSDVVTLARREFAKKKSCNSEFIKPMEQIIDECLHCWTVEQKRGIWESTETGIESKKGFNALKPASIDSDLEGELLYHVMESLAPAKKGKR